MTWETFKMSFLDIFFPREQRESKVQVFINHPQGCMSVKEYSLKFIKLVFNARDEMSCFVMGVSKELEEECHAVMLHDNMDLFSLLVHVQQVEDSRLRK